MDINIIGRNMCSMVAKREEAKRSREAARQERIKYIFMPLRCRVTHVVN